MDKEKLSDKKQIIKIVKLIICVILTLVFTLSALGATALAGARGYLQSEIFKNEIRAVDLKTVEFETSGGTTNVLDYIYANVNGAMSETVFGKFNVSKDMISSFLSAEIVDKAVKDALMECIEYYLNSDYKDAKDRIKTHTEITHDSVTISDFKDPGALIKAYVTNVIHSTIENTTEKSSDEVIVLVSKHTQNTLVTLAVISGVLLIAVCCVTGILYSLIFFGGASMIYGIVIKVMQLKFENAQTDKSLIGYVLLEPLADSFSSSANIGIIAGILLIGVFLTIAILPKTKKEEQ